MTLSEFKAWFAGYTEQMDGPPNGKQWKRIQKRVNEIDGTVTTERIFIDRWYPRYRQYWETPPLYPYYSTCSANETKSMTFSASGDAAAEFDSAKAMLALGKAEFTEAP